MLLLSASQPGDAAVINGSTSLCQCTPRNVTTSGYLDNLNSYTTDMLALLSAISTQLQSLGLKFSDFSTSVLARLLQISASTAQATKVANALLASLNSSSGSSSSTSSNSSTAPNCTVTDSLAFFGSSVYEALGTGGTYSSSKWTVALSTGALTIDYGVKSCTTQTQYVEQICIDGYPSQVYIFVQSTINSSASLLTESLTTNSQTGSICISVQQYIMAFTVLPKSLKSLYSLMPNYQFSLTVTGCFTAIPARCTPTVAPTTVTPCVFGNALSEVSILPVAFFYNALLDRVNGFVINASADGTASATFLADLTADNCRTPPNVTQVCAAGNFKRMKIGSLADYQGTIEEFPGSVNVTAPSIYTRFCYNINKQIAILAIQPAELFKSGETQFKFFPEARGCYNPVASSCTDRPSCVGPLTVGWHSEQLPQQSLTTTNMTYTGGQWVSTGSGATLSVDMSAGGCRKSAAVTQVCVTSTSASLVTLTAIFPVGLDQFFSTINLTGPATPTPGSPWCRTYSAAPTMLSLYISFPESSTLPINLNWTITGCFSSLPAYCLTTTAAPVSTVATTTVRPVEVCSSGFPTITDSNADLPAIAISGGTFVSSSKTWTVNKGDSLTFDLTVSGCRQSARLAAICLLGNVATVRIDYVLEDNTRVVVSGSTNASELATGVALCFTFPSVYSKSLVLLPTALKTASAADATYSVMVNLSACYSAVSASCYSPVCGCSTNYRPVFYRKRYYKIAFNITSGYYSVYKSTYATPITSDYQDLLNMTDTMIWLNFGNYKDKYEGIDQVTFASGSVVFSARLIMYDGGYNFSGLDTALTAGMSSYTAGGTFTVSPDSIVITDLDTTATTTVASTAAAVSTDLALLLGLLIPLSVLLIFIIVLSILLCKYCPCCCFSKTDSVNADVKTSMQEAGTSTSTAQLIDPLDKPLPSAREEAYQYSDGDNSGEQRKTEADSQLPMPQPQQQQEGAERERRRQRKKQRRSTVTPLATGGDGGGASAEAAGIMSGAQPFQFDRGSAPELGPNTPKTVTIETFTYQLRQPAGTESQAATD